VGEGIGLPPSGYDWIGGGMKWAPAIQKKIFINFNVRSNDGQSAKDDSRK
jgi:hypothetical protein